MKRYPLKQIRIARIFWEKHPAFRCSVYALLTFCLLTFILSANFIPNPYRLELGKPSPTDRFAQRDVDVVDKAATEEARQKEEYQIPFTYTVDPRKTHASEQELREVFRSAAAVTAQVVSPERRLLVLRKTLPFPISEKTLLTLLSAGVSTRNVLETQSEYILRKVMDKGVREDNVPQARIDIERLAKVLPWSENSAEAVTELAQEALQPDKFPDWAGMDAKRAEIVKKYEEEPVMRRIEKGSLVVAKGEILTDQKMDILKKLGYFSSSPTASTILGMAVLALFFIGLSIFYLLHHHPELLPKEKHLLLLSVIILITVLISKFLILESGYLAPIAMASILIAILFDSRLSLFETALLSLMMGLLTNEMRYMVVSFVGGCVAVFSVWRVSNRFHLISASFLVAVANLVSIMGFSLLLEEPFSQFSLHALYGIVNGIGSVILAIGILPFLEHFSGVTTPFRLLELADPNVPLLRNFLVECPGTYHHSIVVANLAENAAQAIKADALLARVGAYYHDIGKMKRPYFFIENQMGGENPHDKLNPTLSTLIVTAHTKDGLEMAKAHKLPQEICDIIAQHHGTRPVNYFYHQAAMKEGSENVNRDDFRHEGPKPQSKEAAILMLSDVVEAATRSLAKPTPSKIEQTIREAVRDALLDGQLDECNLSFKELEILIGTYIRLLTGMYHHRIEYPDMTKLAAAEKPRKGQVLRFGNP